MPIYPIAIVLIGWLVWVAPFLAIRRSGVTPQRVDPRARWGIVIEGLGFALVWQNRLWAGAPGVWRVLPSILFLILASALSWTGRQALGRQWRVDAALNADHDLVRSGPYRFVRHPIYASMLCMLLATGLMLARWPIFAAAVALAVLGTEIRVRVEDGLLSARFGEAFVEFRRRVPAYVPFVR